MTSGMRMQPWLLACRQGTECWRPGQSRGFADGELGLFRLRRRKNSDGLLGFVTIVRAVHHPGFVTGQQIARVLESSLRDKLTSPGRANVLLGVADQSANLARWPA